MPADNGSIVGTLTLPTPYDAQQFTTDLSGQLYVAACSPANTVGKVFVYPPNSIGAAAPSSTIEIGSCGGNVSDILELTVDPAGQFLYVKTPASIDTPKTISVYSVAASGTPVPVRTLQGTEYWGDIGADANGDIFVAVEGLGCNGAINVYGPTATGSDAPARTIAFENGQQPVGLAVDASGDIFAIEGDCHGNWAIEEFAAGAEGLVTPIKTINLPPLPAGATEGDGFVRLDAAANIFAAVLISAPPSNATSAIYKYVPTATGHAAPTLTINYGAQWPLFALN